MVAAGSPCLLCQEVDLSNIARFLVKRIQNKDTLGVILCTCNICRHGYTNVCMHRETSKAFKRTRQNSRCSKKNATTCANSKFLPATYVCLFHVPQCGSLDGSNVSSIG